ncbi:hypothetical protein LUW77_02515 [Streptomyces radiopugnans]|nr:hypothetical protein LUW77_02515 [Streptomyces radiopugnans]
MPDYFDRLLTRHVPAVRGAEAAPGGGPGVPVRVRPRLPEPYERVEALRGGAPGAGGSRPLPPARTPSGRAARGGPGGGPARAGDPHRAPNGGADRTGTGR